MRFLMKRFTTLATQSDENHPLTRHAWLIDTIFDEIMHEAQSRDMSEEKLQDYLTQFGQVLAWCGTGDERLLPSDVRDHLWEQHPELMRPAIEGNRHGGKQQRTPA